MFVLMCMFAGIAFTGIKTDSSLYPSVGMKKPGEHLRVNFGRTPFVFDIDGLMSQRRQSVFSEIRKTDVSALHPPDDENTLIQKLVAQYLQHEGYVETAKAFNRDVYALSQSLSSSPQPYQPDTEDEDHHAVNRQRIRRAILDGDIDRALKFTGTYYPRVLQEERNRDVWFRLRCRKFVEMMRRYAEIVAVTRTSSPVTVTKGEVRHDEEEEGEEQEDEDEEGDDTQMELDDQLHRETSLLPQTDDIDMDASQELPSKSSFMKKDDLLAAALQYGQELQVEFGSDPRPEVKQYLRDLFAIIAYPDPRQSPIAGLLEEGGRRGLAESVNGAILGKSQSSHSSCRTSMY
jgi:Ran-binding protein 9/10